MLSDGGAAEGPVPHVLSGVMVRSKVRVAPISVLVAGQVGLRPRLSVEQQAGYVGRVRGRVGCIDGDVVAVGEVQRGVWEGWAAEDQGFGSRGLGVHALSSDQTNHELRV